MSEVSEEVSEMHAEKVLQRGSDEEIEALRMWAWFAIKQAGGKIVVSYADFFTCQGNATLHWRVDPGDLTLTVVAT